MADNNQKNPSSDSNQNVNQDRSQGNDMDQRGNANNPQDGQKWDNYRTREVSSNTEQNNESQGSNMNRSEDTPDRNK